MQDMIGGMLFDSPSATECLQKISAGASTSLLSEHTLKVDAEAPIRGVVCAAHGQVGDKAAA